MRYEAKLIGNCWFLIDTVTHWQKPCFTQQQAEDSAWRYSALVRAIESRRLGEERIYQKVLAERMRLPLDFQGVVGRRFEPHFEPEWDKWCIIDRATGKLHECEDQHSAEREADSLERVNRLVEGVADHFTVA